MLSPAAIINEARVAKVQIMTEQQVIEACRKLARRRGQDLGPLMHAVVLTEDRLPPEFGDLVRQRVGQWSVSFLRPRGFPTADLFWVDDKTGRVNWINGLPPRWFQYLVVVLSYVLKPLEILLGPVFWLLERITKAWLIWRLPRCPDCRAKLRTKLAKQCVECGKSWRDAPSPTG
jgi:hypothetical protein